MLRNPVRDMLYLVDWKRSEKLQDKYQGYGKYMRPPLHQLSDCQGEHYRLQLNIYRWILEKYYGVGVAAMKVVCVCVHPRYLPDGFVDEVPDLQDHVTCLMQSRRDELQAIKLAQLPADPRLAESCGRIPNISGQYTEQYPGPVTGTPRCGRTRGTRTRC